jgi:hypothetical protein
LGYPTGADNESIDADLAREYPGTAPMLLDTPGLRLALSGPHKCS